MTMWTLILLGLSVTLSLLGILGIIFWFEEQFYEEERKPLI